MNLRDFAGLSFALSEKLPLKSGYLNQEKSPQRPKMMSFRACAVTSLEVNPPFKKQRLKTLDIQG